MVISFIQLGSPHRIAAQPSTSQTLPQLSYYFRKLRQTEGLSSYYVKKIIQDRYGYMWIATQDGLNRFDGKNITLYNTSAAAARQLVSPDIWDLVEDTALHRLWVLSYWGLNSIDLSTGQVLPNPPPIAANSPAFRQGYLKSMFLANNRLWIGSHYGLLLYDIPREAFVKFQPLPPEATDSAGKCDIEHFWRDEYGRVWVLIANYGIVLYSETTGLILQQKTLAQLGMQPQKDFDRFAGITPLSKGRLAIVTNKGLLDVHYDRYGFTVAPFALTGAAAGLAQKPSFACNVDTHGNLWFGTSDALYRLQLYTGRIEQIKDADNSDPENWFSNIYNIFFDRFDHLWLGTQKGVAFSPTMPSPFTAYFLSSDYTTTINHANFSLPYQDSLLLVCAEDGLYRINSLSKNIRRLAKGEFMYITPFKDDNLLVSGKDTLFLMQGDKFVPLKRFYPELAPLSTESIQGLTWCGDTLAILGSNSNHGIFCWYPRRHTYVQIEEKSDTLAREHSSILHLASNVVNGVYRDHRGRVWILSNALCSIYDPARSTIDSFRISDPYTHNPAGPYFNMVETSDTYWLAVYGTGLLGLDSSLRLKRSISTREGMSNAGVYTIFPWQDSILFVTSNNGLSRINLKDSTTVNYYQKDGLHGNGFEEFSGYFDGRFIYAGGERGVTRIDPSLISADPAPPPLRIGNIRLQTASSVYDLGDISSPTLTIPSDVVQASLNVFTFNYTDDARTQLFYNIPELNTQWLSLGSNQAIDLLGLSPRRYTLLIKASNPNSPGADRQLTLAIDWLPKWYQTLWFKFLLLAAAIGLFYLFYRYRISQIRQQQHIRQNISSDLHDDIGSILNTIGIFTQLARKGPSADTWLAHIETSLAQAVVAVRDIIWVLDDSNDTVYDLVERIRQFAIPVTVANEIHLEVIADTPGSQPLLKDEKRNLLLIAKESVNNSIKYASCANINILLSSLGKSILLRIEDDGIGFDASKASNGNGLKNIRRRAQKMHYNVTIDSTPGEGTRIILVRN